MQSHAIIVACESVSTLEQDGVLNSATGKPSDALAHSPSERVVRAVKRLRPFGGLGWSGRQRERKMGLPPGSPDAPLTNLNKTLT